MKTVVTRSYLFIIGLVVFMGLSTGVFAQDAAWTDYKYYFDLYGVEVVTNPGVETAFPTWAKPNPDQNITDLAYWVDDVLPFAEDRNADKYIVYPKHGVIVPVLTPSASDQKLIDKWEMFNHFPYLEKGALHYFWYDAHQGYGNMVIAWHSSYNKNSAGRYKTTFQVLPISKPGEKIFIYLKNTKGTYDFFEYTITDSFRTNRFNVSIMEHTPNEYTLTTYGCYIIGSNEERWVNKATLTSKKFAQSDLTAARMHSSADDEAPATFLSANIQPTVAGVQPTNTVSKLMRARAISNAYKNDSAASPTVSRLSITQLISARLATQARDAQEATSSLGETKVNTTTEVEEHSAANDVATETTTIYSAAEIIASLLRPKITLQQEIVLNARARQVLSSRTQKEVEDFISKLTDKKDSLTGKTDKISLWKDVIITHLLGQLQTTAD